MGAKVIFPHFPPRSRHGQNFLKTIIIKKKMKMMIDIVMPSPRTSNENENLCFNNIRRAESRYPLMYTPTLGGKFSLMAETAALPLTNSAHFACLVPP